MADKDFVDGGFELLSGSINLRPRSRLWILWHNVILGKPNMMTISVWIRGVPQCTIGPLTISIQEAKDHD